MVMMIVIGLPCVTFVALMVKDEARRRKQAQMPQELPLIAPASPETFAPIQVVDRFPPVTGFQTMDVAAANMVLSDDELVVAVEIDGQARAYPINMLTGPSREIINDELGGTAIAATW